MSPATLVSAVKTFGSRAMACSQPVLASLLSLTTSFASPSEGATASTKRDRGNLILSLIVGTLAFVLTALSVAKRRRREKEDGAEVSPVPFRRYFLAFVLGTVITFVATRLVTSSPKTAGGGAGGGGGIDEGGPSSTSPPDVVGGAMNEEDVVRQAMSYIRSDPPPF